MKGRKEIEIARYFPQYCSPGSYDYVWNVPEDATAESWFMSLSDSEKAKLCETGTRIQISIRENFGAWGSELCSRYSVRCADYRK